MSLQSNYVNRVAEAFGRSYFGAWLPDSTYSLGEYGLLEDGVFSSHGCIGSVPTVIDQEPSGFGVRQSRNVRIDFKAAMQSSLQTPSIPFEKAGLGLTFDREGSFIIIARECYEDAILHPGSLADLLIGKLDGDLTGNSRFRVVTRVRRMPLAHILVAERKGAHIELLLGGGSPPALEDLAGLDAGLSLAGSSEGVMVFSPARGVTPLVFLSKLEKVTKAGPDSGSAEPGASGFALVPDEIPAKS
jgi:hypothetical protein